MRHIFQILPSQTIEPHRTDVTHDHHQSTPPVVVTTSSVGTITPTELAVMSQLGRKDYDNPNGWVPDCVVSCACISRCVYSHYTPAQASTVLERGNRVCCLCHTRAQLIWNLEVGLCVCVPHVYLCSLEHVSNEYLYKMLSQRHLIHFVMDRATVEPFPLSTLSWISFNHVSVSRQQCTVGAPRLHRLAAFVTMS